MTSDDTRDGEGFTHRSMEIPPLPAYVSPPAPTIFADTAVNISPSPTTVRFYLSRFDPDPRGADTGQQTVVAQVIMPIDRFIQIVSFFRLAIINYGDQGLVDPAMLEELKAGITLEK